VGPPGELAVVDLEAVGVGGPDAARSRHAVAAVGVALDVAGARAAARARPLGRALRRLVAEEAQAGDAHVVAARAQGGDALGARDVEQRPRAGAQPAIAGQRDAAGDAQRGAGQVDARVAGDEDDVPGARRLERGLELGARAHPGDAVAV